MSTASDHTLTWLTHAPHDSLDSVCEIQSNASALFGGIAPLVILQMWYERCGKEAEYSRSEYMSVHGIEYDLLASSKPLFISSSMGSTREPSGLQQGKIHNSKSLFWALSWTIFFLTNMKMSSPQEDKQTPVWSHVSLSSFFCLTHYRTSSKNSKNAYSRNNFTVKHLPVNE